MVDGVPARKRRFAGGASGIDCSTLVPSSMSTSPRSEEGKSRAGTTDSDEDQTRRDAFILKLGPDQSGHSHAILAP